MSIVITELQEGWEEGEIVLYHGQQYTVVETAEDDGIHIVALLEPIEDED
jgi:hypothetical protein